MVEFAKIHVNIMHQNYTARSTFPLRYGVEQMPRYGRMCGIDIDVVITRSSRIEKEINQRGMENPNGSIIFLWQPNRRVKIAEDNAYPTRAEGKKSLNGTRRFFYTLRVHQKKDRKSFQDVFSVKNGD